MEKFFDRFKLLHEKEEYHVLIENISNGVAFSGTNLWILIFAIFIASLGLNVNSTAVIIGALLISPLMGPIMGLGLGINDLPLLRKLLLNFGYFRHSRFAAPERICNPFGFNLGFAIPLNNSQKSSMSLPSPS